jgi:heme/copper-type cytochrome/quinol oxidase subunit 1
MDTFHLIVVMAITFGLVFGGVAGAMSLVMRHEKGRERRRIAEAMLATQEQGMR